MDKEFVPYEEALTLKELGFDEPCLAKHDLKNILLRVEECKSQESASELDYILAPLYQQAFRWFRNTHKLSGEILSHQFYFKYQIIFDSRGCNTCRDILSNFNTYEEAEHACLNALIDKLCEEKEQDNLNNLI